MMSKFCEQCGCVILVPEDIGTVETEYEHITEGVVPFVVFKGLVPARRIICQGCVEDNERDLLLDIEAETAFFKGFKYINFKEVFCQPK